MRGSVDLIVDGGDDKLKRFEACEWIDGEMTTDFPAIKVFNSYGGNKGNCFGRVLEESWYEQKWIPMSSVNLQFLLWIKFEI